jgi:hypothetical protein
MSSLLYHISWNIHPSIHLVSHPLFIMSIACFNNPPDQSVHKPEWMDGRTDGVKVCVIISKQWRKELSTIYLTSQVLPSKRTGLLTNWSGGFLKGAMDILKS